METSVVLQSFKLFRLTINVLLLVRIIYIVRIYRLLIGKNFKLYASKKKICQITFYFSRTRIGRANTTKKMENNNMKKKEKPPTSTRMKQMLRYGTVVVNGSIYWVTRTKPKTMCVMSETRTDFFILLSSSVVVGVFFFFSLYLLLLL